jgi:hypothetical protein
MSPFSIIFGIYGLYKLLSIINEKNIEKEKPLAYSEIINTHLSEIHEQLPLFSHPKYNYINGIIIHDSLLNYYSDLLQLNEEPEINLDVIYDHFQNQTEQLENAQNLGLMQESKIYDLIAAREYMYDMCRYFGNKN